MSRYEVAVRTNQFEVIDRMVLDAHDSSRWICRHLSGGVRECNSHSRLLSLFPVHDAGKEPPQFWGDALVTLFVNGSWLPQFMVRLQQVAPFQDIGCMILRFDWSGLDDSTQRLWALVMAIKGTFPSTLSPPPTMRLFHLPWNATFCDLQRVSEFFLGSYWDVPAEVASPELSALGWVSAITLSREIIARAKSADDPGVRVATQVLNLVHSTRPDLYGADLHPENRADLGIAEHQLNAYSPLELSEKMWALAINLYLHADPRAPSAWLHEVGMSHHLLSKMAIDPLQETAESTVIRRECDRCLRVYCFSIPRDALDNIRRGSQTASEALPSSTKDLRELLISRMCGSCFEAVFVDADGYRNVE